LPDPRLNAFRPDLADAALRGRVEASRYVTGEQRQVTAPVLPVRREPRFDATLDTEALQGEIVTVFDESEGWAWAQLARDAYVGYMPSAGLARTIVKPTHRVATLRTYGYREPDGKAPALHLLSLNARVTGEAEEGKFVALVGGGFVPARHLVPEGETTPDHVAVAEQFLGAPYLWGGRTSVGLDCSGLVQLAAEAAGHSCPRDADMQAVELGQPIDPSVLRRGDLVFWEGHVGIMTSGAHLLHANAHHMAVELEPFALARERIRAAGYEVTCVRRLPSAGAAASAAKGR
jgi:cell wall-associated NlpC family hydrolase